MATAKNGRASGEDREPYERNAQHGQNRAGVDLEDDLSFDEFESAVPIDPSAADARVDDEGPEIAARVHARGHDVLGEDDASDDDRR